VNVYDCTAWLSRIFVVVFLWSCAHFARVKLNGDSQCLLRFLQVVELRLRNLGQIQEAFDLVRQTGSAQGALLVAEYCQEVRDYRGAVEFLLMANKSDEAFKLAQSQGQVWIGPYLCLKAYFLDA
jgi:hypothetical protein